MTSLRPFPNWFNTRIGADYDRSGNSNYHGLNLGLQKRFSAGLTFLTSYSYSKSIDDGAPAGNDIFGVTNQQTAARERAVSNYDMTHKFRASFSYELPIGRGKQLFSTVPAWLNQVIGGYTLSGTTTRQSGWPGVVYLGNSGWWQSRGGGTGNDGWTLRPDRLTGASSITPTWREDPFRRTYFDPNAFVVPRHGSRALPSATRPRTLGDARSPITTTLDVSGSKNIRLWKDGRVMLQLRADAFNILNHPPLFLNPNSRSNGVWEYLANTPLLPPQTDRDDNGRQQTPASTATTPAACSASAPASPSDHRCGTQARGRVARPQAHVEPVRPIAPPLARGRSAVPRLAHPACYTPLRHPREPLRDLRPDRQRRRRPRTRRIQHVQHPALRHKMEILQTDRPMVTAPAHAPPRPPGARSSG